MGDYLKPKAMSAEELFRQRSEDFRFRNPMGNEFTIRGREPEISGSRSKRYEKMMGTQTEWSRKGRPF